MPLNVKVAQNVYPTSLMLMHVEQVTKTQHQGSREDAITGLYFTTSIDPEKARGKRAALYRMTADGNSMVDNPDEILAYFENLSDKEFPYTYEDFLGVPMNTQQPRGGARNGDVEDA